MIESVPNLSEGRDPVTIAALEAAVRAVPGARLLHATSDPDHNRSVLTFAGEPDAVLRAALALAEAAIERIDLTGHSGVHPRTGALDVLPFVPLAGATLEQCARLAIEAGEEIWSRFRVPVYLYEASARDPAGCALETFRRPTFQGPPDIGEGRHPTAGAVIAGARNILIAWNIWLHSTDLALAQSIARRIRFSSGGFPGVKALGLPLAAHGCVQVSINSTDFGATPLTAVFTAVEQLARAADAAIIGCELIGLIPERALPRNLPWLNLASASILESHF